MPPEQRAVLDDRLLIEHILVGLATNDFELYTTACWYLRARRAAVAGAGGQLSGPFERLDRGEQERAGDPQPPRAARGHRTSSATSNGAGDGTCRLASSRLNLLDMEVVAAGDTLDATIWLSPPAASGVLPAVLDAENIAWTTIGVT